MPRIIYLKNYPTLICSEFPTPRLSLPAPPPERFSLQSEPTMNQASSPYIPNLVRHPSRPKIRQTPTATSHHLTPFQALFRLKIPNFFTSSKTHKPLHSSSKQALHIPPCIPLPPGHPNFRHSRAPAPSAPRDKKIHPDASSIGVEIISGSAEWSRKGSDTVPA